MFGVICDLRLVCCLFGWVSAACCGFWLFCCVFLGLYCIVIGCCLSAFGGLLLIVVYCCVGGFWVWVGFRLIWLCVLGFVGYVLGFVIVRGVDWCC